jgi:hypothetical protein
MIGKMLGHYEITSLKVTPDGKWVADASNQTGRHEIFVRPFPPDAKKGQEQISANVGILNKIIKVWIIRKRRYKVIP